MARINTNEALASVQNMQPNTGLPMLQNMPQANTPVQYNPPVPMNSKQTAQQKYPNAKFPRAREGWEKIKGAAFGSPDTVEQYQNYTPEQQSILQFLQQLGVQGLENPYGGFAPIAQQSVNDFHQNTVPTLAERFTSLGNNALSSPAFASQLGQAGAGLHGDLAAQQSQYGQQNVQQLLQMLQLGLNPQSESIFRPGQSGFAQQAALAAIKSFMAGIV